MKTTKYLLVIFLSIQSISAVFAQSWWQQNPKTLANMNNINFVDNNNGWAFGDSLNGVLFVSPIIRKTTNQGANWTTQSLGSNNYQINSSHFFSTTNGMVVGKYLVTGKGTIISTTNGGNTWTTNDTIQDALRDVFFINATTGWICGENGYLIKTLNGGTTWAKQTSNALDHLFSIHFSDANNGWAVGPNGQIIHTSNGGTTWALQTSSVTTQDLFGVYALNATTAFAVGSNGTMIKTINSGTTWSLVTVPTVEHIFDITFTTANNGWVVGAAGNIEITSNAGATWTTQVSNTTKDIKSISMKNNGLGWYAGKSGTVYYYGITPVSVKEIYNSNAAEIIVYPNPVTTSVTFSVTDKINRSGYTLIIYDLFGKQIMQNYTLSDQGNSANRTLIKINCENIEVGTYFYKIEGTKEILKTGKLIIQ